jgi:integral membrane sensor domain MASE1
VVAHVLATGVATSLGYSGALAPAVAGWLPTVVFGVVVVLQAIRLWKQM